MKKLITIALIFMVTFIAVGNRSQKVEAQQELLIPLNNWTSQNIFSTFFIMNSGSIEFPVDFDLGTLSFFIPNSTFNTDTIGGQASEIVIRDIDGNTLATIALTSIKSGSIGGLYSVDLSAFPTAHNVVIFIAQTYTATPAGYVQYYNDNSYLLLREPFFARFFVEGTLIDTIPFINTVIEPSTYPTSSTAGNEFIEWIDEDGIDLDRWRAYGKNMDFYALFSGGATRPIDTLTLFKDWQYFGPLNILETVVTPIPDGSGIMTMFIPRSNRLRYETIDGESIIGFQIENESDQIFTLSEILKADIVGPFLEQPSGLFTIDLREIPNNPNNRVTDFYIQIYSTELPNPDFLLYMNRNTYLEFTSDLFRAQWFVGDTIFETNFFSLFPERPTPNPTPVAPLEFRDWVDDNNQPFNPNVVYEGNQRFYARFRLPLVDESVTPPIDPPNATPPLEAFLIGLGLFNTEGFLFLFALVIILVNFALVYYKLGLGLIIVSNVIIAGMFMFLQFLPFWASFLFVSVIVFMIMLINGGMTRYE